jgi:hypothetical protein
VWRVGILANDGQLTPPQASAVREEDLAELRQPLGRFVLARRLVVAVRPFVVAGGVDERVSGGVELLLAAPEELVTAEHGGAGLEVPDVNHEGKVRPV